MFTLYQLKINRPVLRLKANMSLTPALLLLWWHHWHKIKPQQSNLTQVCTCAGRADVIIWERIQRRKLKLRKRFWKLGWLFLQIAERLSHYFIMKFHLVTSIPGKSEKRRMHSLKPLAKSRSRSCWRIATPIQNGKEEFPRSKVSQRWKILCSGNTSVK